MSKLKTWSSLISVKIAFQIIFILVLSAFIIYFIKNNSLELHQSYNLIINSQPFYIVVAVFFSFMFIYFLGNIYKAGFNALCTRINLIDTIILSLKRNFVSVFLPAGSILSYAMFTSDIENKGVSKTKIYLATVIYAISCTASLLIISIPALTFLLFSNELSNHFIIGFSILAVFLATIFIAFRSIFRKGFLYKLLSIIFPGKIQRLNELYYEKYSFKSIATAVMFSLFAELCGVIHLFLVSKALQIDLSISAIIVSYAISTITYALSPFMRGVGAVEITLSLSLISFGVPKVSAISISIFYRFFTFWLPLFISGLSFLYNKKKLINSFIPVLNGKTVKKEISQ